MRETDKRALPERIGRITLGRPVGKGALRLLAFIGCLAVLVAAFAASWIWTGRGESEETVFRGLFRRERETRLPEAAEDPTAPTADEPKAPEDPPAGTIPVLSQTLYEPVRPSPGGTTAWRIGNARAVLVLCTDPREAYLPGPADGIDGEIGVATYSDDPTRTVERVASALAGVLRENGIETFVAMPEKGETLSGVYARAAKTIRAALAEHPDIGYVIDIGRDSLFDEEGNYIRTIAAGAGEPTAQVLAILGDGTAEDPFPDRREDLAMAEALGDRMETALPTVFRGIALRETPCNQPLAPRALTLRVGSGGNTIEEAVRAAEIVGQAFADLLNEP